MAEFISYLPVKKTAKPHRCYGCGETIQAGSQAYRWTTVDDVITTTYLCSDCATFFDTRCQAGCCLCNDDGYAEGFVAECVLEERTNG